MHAMMMPIAPYHQHKPIHWPSSHQCYIQVCSVIRHEVVAEHNEWKDKVTVHLLAWFHYQCIAGITKLFFSKNLLLCKATFCSAENISRQISTAFLRPGIKNHSESHIYYEIWGVELWFTQMMWASFNREILKFQNCSGLYPDPNSALSRGHVRGRSVLTEDLHSNQSINQSINQYSLNKSWTDTKRDWTVLPSDEWPSGLKYAAM